LTSQVFQASNVQLENTKTTISIHSNNRIHRNEQLLLSIQQKLVQRSPDMLKRSGQLLESIEKHLQLVDPIHVLKRGYSIVTNEKGVISKANLPEKGEEIRIIQADVTVIAETIRLETEKRNPEAE